MGLKCVIISPQAKDNRHREKTELSPVEVLSKEKTSFDGLLLGRFYFMAISKQKKGEILTKLTDIAKANASVLFVNFHKLTVSDATALRRALRAAGVGYFVAKKTLIKKAFGGAKAAGEMPELGGEVAVAYSNDIIAPAREVYSFQKKSENKVSILGGIFEGAFKNKEEMMSIALIPSRETLYSQIAYLLQSPIQRLAIGLSEVAKAKEKTNS